MIPHIIIYYYNDGALDEYLRRFGYGSLERNCTRIQKTKTTRRYIGEHFVIDCIKWLPFNARGYRAHMIAVQEDLTWRKEWPEFRDCVVKPQLISPIPILIFDGESYEEAVMREEARLAA